VGTSRSCPDDHLVAIEIVNAGDPLAPRLLGRLAGDPQARDPQPTLARIKLRNFYTDPTLQTLATGGARLTSAGETGRDG